MGKVPRGTPPADWNRARLRACHKHLIKHRGRSMVDKQPHLIREAFMAGYCDSSDDVAAFLADTRYCQHCGGVGTLPHDPAMICINCRRGRKLLNALGEPPDESVCLEAITLLMTAAQE